MHETFEFRVVEDFAPYLFAEADGKKLGSIRLVHVDSDDPRLSRIGELQHQIIRECDRSFFHGWDIQRRYLKHELNAAKAFHLRYLHTFEPCGEDCGTIIDESTACPLCGAGATQTSDLRLDLRKAPRSKDIARTIAGEVIVSQRLAELMIAANLKGFEFRRVRHRAKYEDDPIELSEVPAGRQILLKAEAAGVPHPTGSFWVWLNRAENQQLSEQARQEYAAYKRRSALATGKPAPVWHQLVATTFADVVSPTHTGVDPFDDDESGEYRCPRGHTLGLNLLSELTVSFPEDGEWDVAATRQYIGLRSGMLRPERRLLISPRFWRILEDNGSKGYRVEIAHLK